MPTIRERNGKFQAQVRLKRGGVIVHEESATFDTRKQASLWGLTLEKTLATSGVAARKQSKVLVSDILEKHEVMLRELGRDTLAKEHRFKNICHSDFAKKPIGTVTSADIIAWATSFGQGKQPPSRDGKPRAPATVLNHLMALRAAYRAAPLAQDIPADVNVVANAINHLRRVGVVAPSRERDRRVTDAEIAKIAAFRLNQHRTKVPLHTIIKLLIALPRRREEVMLAHWEDYDQMNKTLVLRDTKHPTRVRDEVIPVPPQAQAILASLEQKPGRFFPGTAGRAVSEALHKTAKMLGLQDLRLHDLRHEGISRLFEAGLTIPEVSLISGHTSWASLKRYTHIQPKNVLEKLNASSKRTQENPAQPE